jgi:hypothetical protein
MSENHPSECFTILECYYKDCPVNRRRATPKSLTSAKAKVATALAFMVLGATTGTAAFTTSQRENITGLSRTQSATSIGLAGIITFEDGRY